MTTSQDESVHDGYVIGAFGIVLVGLATVISLSATATIVASFTLYHRWLETVTWITGFGSFLLVIGAVYHGRSRQKRSIVIVGIAAAMGLFLILYIDFFRPELAVPGIFNDAAQFNAFRMTITILEACIAGLSCLGMALTAAALKKNKIVKHPKIEYKPSRSR